MVSFINSYASLPEEFFTRIGPVPVAKPHLIKFNDALAEELGLDMRDLDRQTLAKIFSGSIMMPGSHPIAMVYAGHQFGQFVPQLGDGRATLLGEVSDRNGVRRDLQLKGSGRTPYSRSGDGRAAVGPVLREYVISEAMHALGIPGTRALAAVATGEFIFREGPVPGAILARVAASHVRVGTFQYFAARGDEGAIRQLADYVIDRHYPEIRCVSNPYLELLRCVAHRQARLVASWMQVGFIHGVMNTDNMTVSGESIDFGPCAFMDSYDLGMVFSSIDRRGRYAFGNQSAAAQWNLARFGETLLPLIASEAAIGIKLATEIVAEFATVFDEHWLAGMRKKLGLFTARNEDLGLVNAILAQMQQGRVDFTVFFRGLCAAAEGMQTDAAQGMGFVDPAAYALWAQSWLARLACEAQTASAHAALMRSVNPAFIPRNHRIEQVIAAAVAREDYAPFHELCMVLARPYEDQPVFASYADPPRDEERVLQTFCGT